MKHKTCVYALSLLSLIALFSCRQAEQTSADPAYVQEIETWQQKRIENLTRPDGWLTLAGLYWLKEGENRFGSAPANDLVFPQDKAPAFMGSILLQQGLATVQIRNGVHVLVVDSTEITKGVLYNDRQGKPTVLQHGSLTWYVIQRGEKYGVRLRDRDHINRQQFKGIPRYPVNPEWRRTARFEPYQPIKKIPIVNVLGTVQQLTCPGALIFTIGKKTCRLDALAEPEETDLFVIFKDETSGRETYGSGRFLYATRPNEKGETILDFNKAFNPPCAFTVYATCPLPPAQNHLDLAVTAGEKSYQGGH